MIIQPVDQPNQKKDEHSCWMHQLVPSMPVDSSGKRRPALGKSFKFETNFDFSIMLLLLVPKIELPFFVKNNFQTTRKNDIWFFSEGIFQKVKNSIRNQRKYKISTSNEIPIEMTIEAIQNHSLTYDHASFIRKKNIQNTKFHQFFTVKNLLKYTQTCSKSLVNN